jgi:hypothetical protein
MAVYRRPLTHATEKAGEQMWITRLQPVAFGADPSALLPGKSMSIDVTDSTDEHFRNGRADLPGSPW